MCVCISGISRLLSSIDEINRVYLASANNCFLKFRPKYQSSQIYYLFLHFVPYPVHLAITCHARQLGYNNVILKLMGTAWSVHELFYSVAIDAQFGQDPVVPVSLALVFTTPWPSYRTHYVPSHYQCGTRPVRQKMTRTHSNWLVYTDVFDHLPSCFSSCHPI